MQKITLFTFLVILFTSCTDIFFASPQPLFAEDVSEIPEDFQGEFSMDIGGDSTEVPQFNITSNKLSTNYGPSYSIGDDNFAVKSWGNYLFLNLKDSTEKWELLTILSPPYSSNNTIRYMHTGLSGINIDRFNNVDTIPADTTDKDDYPKYILDEVNTLQFHYLLRMSSKSQIDLMRLEEVIVVEEEIDEDEEFLESDIEENLTTEE